MRTLRIGALLLTVLGLTWILLPARACSAEPAPAGPGNPSELEREMLGLLDAPLLFCKRHSYTGIHIYDTFYKWPPGGGGIYVLENPSAPRSQWKIRPVIDPTTPGTLGLGVYTYPELSWDAKKLLFCFKGEPSGSTSIYEINLDGTGLRRITDPTSTCNFYKGSNGGQHDIAPAYLPDGRIVFLSTRPSGLVPCANSGVSILHVMNADGSDIHPISVNHVNEFDPSVLPDGRILFGRWEYVDKNALTIQSLWSVNPDGTQETAVFANNMVFPEAVLDARNVPGTPLILGTFAKHNSTPRGSIALIDPRKGKNSVAAITNLEHPENPTCDTGDSCEPWPVTQDVFLYSGRPAGATRNVLQMIDRAGRRIVVLSDPDICCHVPMLVKPRPRPAVLADSTDRRATTGRFFLQDIYKGLTGVKRGEVKYLRVIEETSRVSPTLMGGSPYNQVSLVSAALAFNVKNFLGIVPVDETGSAYFEAPAGRGLFFQALDAEGRTVQSMRSFVQAAPGTSRSCIGCHEHKQTTPSGDGFPAHLGRAPARLQPERWGSGYVDYPSMVQPILDRHCVDCHGGEKDIAAGMDLSGGWTEHFNISYENLVNRRETQLTAYWIAGIDCMNGTAFWSSQIFPPRSQGSGAAPLAKILVNGHDGRIASLTRKERDLIMAWIDTNGLYHGHWDATKAGCAIRDWKSIQAALGAQMQSAGCLRCHGDGQRIVSFENDWINLRDPRLSRILRAPLAKGADGFGLGFCRDRKVDPARQRIHLLWNGYAHAVQPNEAYAKHPVVPYDPSGQPVASFASTDDSHYRAMLAILNDAREKVLANPRIDMPGAEVVPGACRMFLPPLLPEISPTLMATAEPEGVVRLSWERSAQTIGLEFELYRSEGEKFTLKGAKLLTCTPLSEYVDREPPPGNQHYALVVVQENHRSRPAVVSVTVPIPPPPPAPTGLETLPASSAVRLRWQAPATPVAGYHVYRGKPGTAPTEKLTAQPVPTTTYSDGTGESEVTYAYVVRAVNLRGIEGQPSEPIQGMARIVKEPVFTLSLDGAARGLLQGASPLAGKLQAPAQVSDGVLDLRKGGHVAFPHQAHFDLAQPFSMECWVRFDGPDQMPIVIGCGSWNQAGWFLQKLGGTWRWHVGGVDCDGGRPESGCWLHMVATYDTRTARLYQDGRQVAERSASFVTAPWPGDLVIGQYSAQVSPPFQVAGRITGVKLYHRALPPAEIVTAAKTKP